MTDLFDKKDVYSWANCEEAKQYIGTDGYIANNVDDLQEAIEHKNLVTLEQVDLRDAERTFQYGDVFCSFYCALFLPADKVKKPEKKWRAFRDSEEFLKITNKQIGEVIILRRKENKKEYRLLLCGDAEKELLFASLGACSLPYLFEYFELRLKLEWQPFGMKDGES